MKSAFTIIYSILCIIVFLALFLFSGLGLYGVYQDNHADCIRNLDNVKSLCVMWQEGIYNGPELDIAVREILQKTDRLLIITIYSPAKGLLYAGSRPAPGTSGYLKSSIKEDPDWKDPDWEGKPEYLAKPLIGSEIISAKIFTDPANDLVVEGVYIVLTYEEIFNVLKYGAIALVILLIISIFVRFFIINEIKQDKDDYSFDIDRPAAHDYEHQVPEAFMENSRESSQESSKEFSIDNSVPEKKAAEPKEAAGSAELQKAPLQALFSPKTGLGWEEHLLSRLGTEIKRTSSFDQDMSFALININRHESLKDFDAVIQGTAKIILELFLFQDLCFEYGQSGFGVILPDIDINQSIKEMEIFQRKIASTPIEDQFITVSIGISSRNGRLINNEILFKETVKALEMASDDPKNNIIAFKPDPDKYRSTVARKM